MDKKSICKKAHEEFTALLEKMMLSFEDDTISISKDEAEQYNLLRNLCADIVMDMQQKNVYLPLSKEIYENKNVVEWVEKMWNTDNNGAKHIGAHWTKEQVKTVLEQYGLEIPGLDLEQTWALLNAIWHDGYKSAAKENKADDFMWFFHRAYDLVIDEDSKKTPLERLHMYMNM